MVKKVTFLMPCLNEARTLPWCVQNAKDAASKLLPMGFESEIVIADNGSVDESVEIATRLGCRVVPVPQKGYGAALMEGIRQAKGQYVVMADADASYDFREAVPMIEKLEQGCELVMGSRFKGRILKGAMPWKNRYIGNPALTGILNLFFRSGFSDAHCGLRAFNREAILKLGLNSPGMEFASEMVVKSTLSGLKRAEAPATLSPDGRDRAPHLRPFEDGWRHLKFLLMYGPLGLFFIPAVALLAFSSSIFILVSFAPPRGTFMAAGFHFGDHWMILSSALFIVGYQSFLLGMTALRYRNSNKLSLVKLWNLETTLLLSFVWFACAVIIGFFVFMEWRSNHYGALYQLRPMVLSAVFLVVSVNTFFSGLLSSMMTVVRD